MSLFTQGLNYRSTGGYFVNCQACNLSVGWYVVWRIFLRRFKFVQELMGENNSSSSNDRGTSTPGSRLKRHHIRTAD